MGGRPLVRGCRAGGRSTSGRMSAGADGDDVGDGDQLTGHHRIEVFETRDEHGLDSEAVHDGDEVRRRIY